VVTTVLGLSAVSLAVAVACGAGTMVRRQAGEPRVALIVLTGMALIGCAGFMALAANHS
jgi:hypothetical protein